MANKTQCPNCLSIYNITDEQFNKSKGKVRCGNCRQPFVVSFMVLESPSYPIEDAIRIVDGDELTASSNDVFKAAPTSAPPPSFDLDIERPRHEPMSEPQDAVISTVTYEGGDTEKGSNEERPPEFSVSVDDTASSLNAEDLISEVDSLIVEKLVKDDIHAEVSDAVSDSTFEASSYEANSNEASSNEDSSEAVIGADDHIWSEEGGWNEPREAEPSLYSANPYSPKRPEPSVFDSEEHSDTEDTFEEHENVVLDDLFVLDPKTPNSTLQRWLLMPMSLVLVLGLAGLLVYQLWLRQALPILENESLVSSVSSVLAPAHEYLSEQVGWTIPVRRDMANLRLTSARLEPHPERSSTTLLKVSLLNQSKIAQPFPALELSLTDENGRLVSRRALSPRDYLHNNRLRNSMRANELRAVTIELLAFPRQAHGYELKIINL